MSAVRHGHSPAREPVVLPPRTSQTVPATAEEAEEEEEEDTEEQILAASQADDDSKRRNLEPAELGRGGDLATTAARPKVGTEEDEWLPPLARGDDDEDMELSGKELGLRFEGPVEQMVQDLVKAQGSGEEAGAAYVRIPAAVDVHRRRAAHGCCAQAESFGGVWAVQLSFRLLKKEHRAAYVQTGK
ncbi:unnamed protein product [Prorocentrum cordatum]|uniref:Uncharacterized protein n=1 Tax=Prorocentrum cordatum TaxID=2364126 RepID=A0ABN9S2Z7_9DINO|nr:unnamed protein product [Polarella glacialis]